AGRLLERRAAGLERTLVFNPYPDALSGGMVDVEFRVRILGDNGKCLSEQTVRIKADNSDVVVVDDWDHVMQRQFVSEDAREGGWQVQRGLPADKPPYAAGGTRLFGPGGTDLPQLTYPLDLKGTYAIYVCAFGAARLRLTGDERYDRLGSAIPHHEQLWAWRRMDWQHLVVRQDYAFTGPSVTSLDYVRLVPLTAEQVRELESRFGTPDRIVVSYWEPYSYAFSDNVQDVYWHRQYMDAYREAGVSIVDAQLGRFGAKVVFESRVADQLLYQTRGDPIGAIRQPVTTNVGRMQQYTNTLQNSLKFCRELGLTLHANFGAGNCYPGSPLQGEFSKEHPQWMRGVALRFEVPEVRKYILALYEEALAIGASGVSIDFCRYPEAIDSKETANIFFRELRELVDKFGDKRGERVRVLARFPAHGVRRSECFDYAAWAREGWVDYLCPSNIQGRFHYFDVKPYQEAVKGTSCILLPQIDALGWGLRVPGLFMWRLARLYEAEVDGIYIYQGDALIARNPETRRYVRMFRSRDAVRRFWEEHRRQSSTRSKGIYITSPIQLPGYHGWERLHVWVEGVPMGELEIYLDGTLVNRYTGPPYLLGSQGAEGDAVLPRGEHELRVRVKDGDGWLVRTFRIVGAG
ncbi:MAG: hypothetical protein GXP31_02080, partial [Kiritimatiellaeota bacterium]|nr:hypothetical protein [Kiritimatiellota bacterium]